PDAGGRKREPALRGRVRVAAPGRARGALVPRGGLRRVTAPRGVVRSAWRGRRRPGNGSAALPRDGAAVAGRGHGAVVSRWARLPGAHRRVARSKLRPDDALRSAELRGRVA